MKLFKKIRRWLKNRKLAKECGKLDIEEETAMAEEGIAFEEWPEY